MGWITGDRIPVEASVFRAVHTGPEDQTSSRVVSTVPFLGIKRQEPGVNHPLPSARLRMGWSYTSTCRPCLPTCDFYPYLGSKEVPYILPVFFSTTGSVLRLNKCACFEIYPKLQQFKSTTNEMI